MVGQKELLMKLIYIGFVVPEITAQQSGAVSVAGNNMEIGILSHLCAKYGNQIDVISITPIASYPKEKKILHKKQIYIIGDNIKINAITFINIPIIKQISIIVSLIIELIRLLRGSKKINNDIVVMTYNSMSFLSIPVFFVDLFFNIIKVCLVVDIPITLQKKSCKYLEVARRIDNYVSLKAFKKYNSMITLVERTVKDFAPKVPYKLINYCVSDIAKSKYEINEQKISNSSRINIVFTGAIEDYYGITEMIQSLSNLPSSYTLYLYGKGTQTQKVENISKNNSRVKYMGLVSHEESIRAQRKANLLLLFITNSELSKYALPSKIIEYLASGTPVMSNRISSIPKDLDQFINYIDNTDPATIASKILYITDKKNYDVILNKTIEARKYILENYVWEKQAEKIWEHIKIIKS